MSFINAENVDRFLDFLRDHLVPQWELEAKRGRLRAKQWDILRKKALKRDNYTCCNCGARNRRLHVHHIVPVEKGGSNKLTNLATACDRCHKKIHPWLDIDSYTPERVP